MWLVVENMRARVELSGATGPYTQHRDEDSSLLRLCLTVNMATVCMQQVTLYRSDAISYVI